METKRTWKAGRILVVAASFLLWVPAATAQDGMITGSVVDQETGEPLPSATVLIVGTDVGAATDFEGAYVIENVSPGAHSVRASIIGYEVEHSEVFVRAGETVTIDFALSVSAVMLDELVVTASGEEQRLRELGVNIGVVEPAEVDLAAADDLSQLLVGEVAGVTILETSGIVGTGSAIRIRGVNSVNLNNDPLIIIDGVRVNNSTAATSIFAGLGVIPSRIADLDPNMIGEIEVIKGPAAAALYGTAAANGVIQITTKRGRYGTARWSAYTEMGNTYEISDFPANYTQYGSFAPGTSSPGCNIVFQASGQCTADSLVSFNPLEVHSPFQTGSRQTYGLSVSGGDGRMSYFLSGNYAGQEGVIEINDLEQVNLRANVGAQVHDDLNLSLSSGYMSSELRIPNGAAVVQSGLTGAFRDDSVTLGYIPRPPSEFFAIETRQYIDRLIGSFNADWQPLDWLSFYGTTGLDFILRRDQQTRPANLFGSAQPGSRTSNNARSVNYTVKGSSAADFDLTPDLHSTTTVGVQFYRDFLTATRASGSGLPVGISSLSGTSLGLSVGESYADVRTLGGFIQQQFSWQDRLYLTTALRGDDNSAFGRALGVTYYPAVNVSWVLGEAPWFPQSDWVSSLRLRAGWGESGLRPEFRQAKTYYSPTSAVVDGQEVPAVVIGGIGNIGLRPEQVSEFELGFDAGFWQDRIAMEFSYFDKESEDALIERVLPPSTGLTARFENIGKVRNSGFEAAVDARLLSLADVQWDLRFSGSILDNELVRLGENIPPIPLPIIDGLQSHREGYPLGSYFGRRIVSFEDVNGDGILGSVCPGPGCEITLSDSSEFLGSSFPLEQLSVSTSVTLFDFIRLYGLVDYKGDYKRLNLTELLRCISGKCLGINSPEAPLAEQAAAVATFSRFFVGPDRGTLAGFVEDASFWRLREVALTLLLPGRWAQTFGAHGLSFTLSGRNLAIWTDYSGLDPEVNSLFGASPVIAESSTLPPTRQYTARLTVDF